MDKKQVLELLAGLLRGTGVMKSPLEDWPTYLVDQKQLMKNIETALEAEAVCDRGEQS